MTEPKTKFTQGPWFVCLENHSLVLRQRDRDNNGYQPPALVVATGAECVYSASEIEANAALIAAAPEMYELLSEMLDNWDTNDIDVLAEYAGRIERLLSKARGEANHDN